MVLFAFLVCAFYKEPVVASDFSSYIPKITLNFLKRFKIADSLNKTLKIISTCKNDGGPPYALNKKYL